MKYIATKKCWNGNHLYKTGDYFLGSGKPPKHFVPESGFTAEAVAEAEAEEKAKYVRVKPKKVSDAQAARGPDFKAT